MSNNWLSSGRYNITQGVYKRLWGPTQPLSEVIVQSIVRKRTIPGGGEEYILTELGENILTEADEEMILD